MGAALLFLGDSVILTRLQLSALNKHKKPILPSLVMHRQDMYVKGDLGVVAWGFRGRSTQPLKTPMTRFSRV
jgi:hypothetical protein